MRLAIPHAQTPPALAPARMSWARLLKRVFDIDIEYCPRCGGRLKIIATIVDPPVIAKILTHLHLSARAPPRSAARRGYRMDTSLPFLYRALKP